MTDILGIRELTELDDMITRRQGWIALFHELNQAKHNTRNIRPLLDQIKGEIALANTRIDELVKKLDEKLA